MNIENNINAFAQLGDFIRENPVSLQEIVHKTFVYNTWFTVENTNLALQNIAIEFLEKEKQQIIDAWENGYEHGACINKDKDKYHGTQYFNETFKN